MYDKDQLPIVREGPSRETYLTVLGHFYQPPREDPFTGEAPQEAGAAPFHDYNEKINAECYRPNAELGNFEHLSFDLGPTLAAWLEKHDRGTLELIVGADRAHRLQYGVGNAMALPYNHTILPLATAHEKRVQIAWGIAEFERLFSAKPAGMWLPETAVDLETLSIVAEFGIEYTVLAPWQVDTDLPDPTEPYRVSLPDGLSIDVFFFANGLSGSISFDSDLTLNARVFATTHLSQQINHEKLAREEAQLTLIATDGELYGHHKPWRDLFLKHLVQYEAESAGFAVTTLGRYLSSHPPTKNIRIRPNTAWSCQHGLDRWRRGCLCIEGSGEWKTALRLSLNHLARDIDAVYQKSAEPLLRQPWVALESYIRLRTNVLSEEEFWQTFGRKPFSADERQLALRLLEAQYYRQLMFISDAFFFEDLDRIEPRKAIVYAARAIDLADPERLLGLEEVFLRDLNECRSWRTGRTGADVYHQLMEQHSGLTGHGARPATF